MGSIEQGSRPSFDLRDVLFCGAVRGSSGENEACGDLAPLVTRSAWAACRARWVAACCSHGPLAERRPVGHVAAPCIAGARRRF